MLPDGVSARVFADARPVAVLTAQKKAPSDKGLRFQGGLSDGAFRLGSAAGDRGPVADTVQEILGGVRSACTYVGARRLKELTKRTTFVRVTQQLNEVFGKS